MPNIFHKDHGFVITTDQDQINELLAKGGELVDKCSEYGNEKTEETAEAEVLSKSQIKRLRVQRGD